MSTEVSKILLIDDEQNSRDLLKNLLESSGHAVQAVDSAEKAIQILKDNSFSIIITDLNLPGASGIDILKWVKENCSDTNVILITGMGSAESAVTAMKEGAFDYITKPLNIKELQIVIDKALANRQLVVENRYLRQQLHGKYNFDKIIGTSQAMQQVFRRMEKIALTDSTILILGESGTGKELVAKAIHFNSHRKDNPFIAINCGAIPGDLLESELFGHIRGAFTGAIADKPGKFELANRGTIFLDEISNMPLMLQSKLLRVLQEHEFERVGSGTTVKLDVRVISATNAELEKEVATGNFREDLFYRLNVIPIELPSLKQRHEDILLLAKHFLKKSSEMMGRKNMTISGAALSAMEKYSWPGNVREMENVIERTVALTDGTNIEVSDLPSSLRPLHQEEVNVVPHPRVTTEGVNLPMVMLEIEKEMIEEALRLCSGIKTRAASLLKLNRTTLVEKMKRLGIN
jgi:DNA-binding NtrC family response regulator